MPWYVQCGKYSIWDLPPPSEPLDFPFIVVGRRAMQVHRTCVSYIIRLRPIENKNHLVFLKTATSFLKAVTCVELVKMSRNLFIHSKGGETEPGRELDRER